MNNELPQGWATSQPVRAEENSPRIYPWGFAGQGNQSRGQLVLQDPTDEPAKKLLERIKPNHETKSGKDAR